MFQQSKKGAVTTESAEDRSATLAQSIEIARALRRKRLVLKTSSQYRSQEMRLRDAHLSQPEPLGVGHAS